MLHGVMRRGLKRAEKSPPAGPRRVHGSASRSGSTNPARASAENITASL
jgi:hypothetical protein